MDMNQIFLIPALVSIVVVLSFVAVSKLYELFNRPNISGVKSEFKNMSFGAIGALVILIVLNFRWCPN
jgi:putative solute:sodium symporter small subunit